MVELLSKRHAILTQSLTKQCVSELKRMKLIIGKIFNSTNLNSHLSLSLSLSLLLSLAFSCFLLLSLALFIVTKARPYDWPSLSIPHHTIIKSWTMVVIIIVTDIFLSPICLHWLWINPWSMESEPSCPSCQTPRQSGLWLSMASASMTPKCWSRHREQHSSLK